MVGLGENYFAAFALAIGMSQASSGLVTTVPLFLGAVLQLASPWGVQWLRSYRRWVVACATLQALCFAPLCAFAVTGLAWPPLLFLVIAVYWGTGMATIPAWNAWVEQLVPLRLRASYFAQRSGTSQAALLGGFLLSGLALQLASRWNATQAAFAGLFLLALGCRLASSAFLFSQSEIPATRDVVSAAELIARFRNGSEGRLLIYLIAIQASVQVAGPYFTPFMIRQIKLPYASYALLIGISLLAKIAAFGFWGRVARRCGPHRLLWIGGLGVIPLAGLWLVSQSFVYLTFLQLVSGACWAAYELAMFLLLFDTIAERHRVSVLTAYNFANSTATVAGSLLGGLLLVLLGQTYTAYLAVFGISSLLRAGTVALLARVPADAPSKRELPQVVPTAISSASTAPGETRRIDPQHALGAPKGSTRSSHRGRKTAASLTAA